jgi:hypothetical protein
MMAQPELDRLILNNLADLDAASQHISNELEPAVAKAIDQIVETFLREGEWAGLADWLVKGIWLASEDWRKQGDHTGDDYQCQFTLETNLGQGEAKDSFWLTQLLGVGDRTLGLRWTRNDVRIRQWRTVVGQQQTIIARLRASGFDYQEREGSFFLPVRVDQSALAQAAGDESLEFALSPFSDALQDCINAKPDFDALLAATARID